MPRKTLALPERFIFVTHYDVLYTDVNSANHLGAERLLSIAMEAQLRFIRQLGHSEASAGTGGLQGPGAGLTWPG